MKSLRKPIIRVHALSILFAWCAGGVGLPVVAATDAGAPKATIKSVERNIKTKSIGTLHISEGKVIIRANQLFVLSDANDAIEDAELVGVLLDLRARSDANGGTTDGIAFFTGGFSLGALDDLKVKESVKGNDGVVRVGRIEDVTAKMLRIRTAQGVQAIPTGYILEIKSPRAFSFIVPEAIATATGSIVSTGQTANANMPTPSNRDALDLVSFNPTYTPDPNRAPPTNQVLALNKQLIRKGNSKRLAKTAAMAAGVAACFALPIGIGLACPPQR